MSIQKWPICPILLCLILAALGNAVATGAADRNKLQWGVVDKAIDGDTVILRDGRHVRLIGIDAPEIDHREGTAEPWAIESWQALGRQVNGQKVRIEFDDSLQDTHGRLLAYLFDEKGVFINQQMIDQGLAHVLYVAPNIRYFEALLIAQRKAMKSSKGIWQNLTRDDQSWVGNRHSKRFHRPHCSLGRKIQPANKITFNNRMDAFHQGYAPCKRCITIQKKELRRP